MVNRTTQNRTEVTRAQDSDLTIARQTLDELIARGRVIAAGYHAEFMYHIVYPRTTPKRRTFKGRQIRILAAIKAGR